MPSTSGVGLPGIEQFRDIIVELRNTHIIFCLAPLMDFRSEVIAAPAFSQRGYFNTTTQQYLIQHLQNCDASRRCVTYNPDPTALSDLVKKAIDTSTLIGQGSGNAQTGADTKTPLRPALKPFGGDEVQGAATGLRQLPWAFDGSDPNIPTNSKLNFRSSNGLLFLQALDSAIVSWTRLESRFSSRFITVGDSMRMYAQYVAMLDYLNIFNGDNNLVDFASGVLPSEEPRGPAISPNLLTEDSGNSGINPAK